MSGLGWTILGTIAGLLGLFATLYFGIKSKKKQKEEETKRQGIKLSDINFTIPVNKNVVIAENKNVRFEIQAIKPTRDERFVLDIINKGEGFAGNIKVDVTPSRKGYSQIEIVNWNYFPIGYLGSGQSFFVEIDCYGLHDNNCLISLEWDDEEGTHKEVKEVQIYERD